MHFILKKSIFHKSDSVIQRKEQTYKTTMLVLVVEKQLAQNMGTSNSSSGKTAKSKTCIFFEKKVITQKSINCFIH
jgi:hypothetical protein